MRSWLLPLWAAVLASAPALPQLAPPARDRADSTVVVATSRALAPLVRRAIAAERIDAGRDVRVDVVGSDVAMAELYSGRADAAVIGREATDNEIKAYVWIYGRSPSAASVGEGSLATPGHSPRLAIRVNARNPIRSITLAQLRAAFRSGGSPPTWGELGLSGSWARRPIHLVVPDAESGTGRYLRHVLLADVVQFDWSRVIEIGSAPGDRAIDVAVARDASALGIGAALIDGRARSVPVDVGGMRLSPADPGYPLTRTLMMYAHPDGRSGPGTLLQALKETLNGSRRSS